jgi:hypothetical protein
MTICSGGSSRPSKWAGAEATSTTTNNPAIAMAKDNLVTGG